jgi:hypothetical protein
MITAREPGRWVTDMESGRRYADDGAQRNDASRRNFLRRIGLMSVTATALAGVAEVAGLAPAMAKAAGPKASKYPKIEALFTATYDGKVIVPQAITPDSCPSGYCETSCCLALGDCGGCPSGSCCNYCEGCGVGYVCIKGKCLAACANWCFKPA